MSHFSICVKCQNCASWLGINAAVTDFRRSLCKVKIMMLSGTLATIPNSYEIKWSRTIKKKDGKKMRHKYCLKDTGGGRDVHCAVDLHLNAVCKPLLHALHFKKLENPENQVRSLLSSLFLFRMAPVPLRKCFLSCIYMELDIFHNSSFSCGVAGKQVAEHIYSKLQDTQPCWHPPFI